MTGIEPALSAWESRQAISVLAHPRSQERVGSPYQPCRGHRIPLARARMGHEHLILFDSAGCDQVLAVGQSPQPALVPARLGP